MIKAMAVERESQLGPWARSVRMALKLTQQELANMAGVSLQEVCLFEKNMPVRLDARRKLLKLLWPARNTVCKSPRHSRMQTTL